MKRLLFFLVLIGVGLTGAAYWYNPASRNSGEEGYSFLPAEYGSLVESVSATGILKPREITLVGSQISGEVVKVYSGADFNQPVEKGQPLIQLDDRLAKQKLEMAKVGVQAANEGVKLAEAAREAAKLQAELLQSLVAQKVELKTKADLAVLKVKEAADQLQAAKLKVQAAEEEQKSAQLGVDLTTVRAPQSGVIIDRNVEFGQLVAPPASAKLFTIASDLSRLQVNAQVAEGDISKVRVGLPATFTVYAYSESNEVFKGQVESIRDLPTSATPSLPGGLAGAGAVFYGTIIDVANRRDPGSKNGKGWMLRPGMTATVEIRRREHENVWKIPAAAVSFVLDEYYYTPQAKQKLAAWQSRPDHDDWKTVWIFKDRKPWPLFVRVGGKNAGGETGINDGQSQEVLEWDPELDPKPSASATARFPRFIIAAPPAHKPGFFESDKLKLKLS